MSAAVQSDPQTDPETDPQTEQPAESTVEQQTKAAPVRRITRAPARAVAGARARLSGLSRPGRTVVTAVLAVLIVAAVAAVVVLGVLLAGSAATEQARDEAADAAKADVEQLLSYSSATLDADVARSKALIAPEYAAEFDRLVTQLITPATQQNQLDTKAEALRAGVISAGPDRAEVLVFLRQTTSRAGQPPATSPSRAQVTLTRHDGQWLVAGLTPA